MSIENYGAAGFAGIPGSELGILLVIITVLVAVRIYRNMRGMKFTTTTLYRLPVIYLALTAIDLLAVNPSYLDVVVAAGALAIGTVIGLRIAGGVRFFTKGGAVYYSRSPAIMIIWLLSFIGRFAVEIAYPAVPIAALAVDIVLAGTTGMIVGEAVHIKRNYESYRKKIGAPEQ